MIGLQKARSINNSLMLICGVLLFLVMFFVVPINAGAQAQKGLTITPLRNEIYIEHGTAYSGEITVANSTSKPMSISMSAEEFKVINSQYDYEFIENSDLSSWVSFIPNEAKLEPGDEIKVKYTIGVPLDTEPGGRYISLFASSAIDDGGSMQRVASMVYITVTSDVLGQSDVSGKLINLSSPWLVISGGSWSALIQNTGISHYRSYYDVQLQDIFGNEIKKNSDSVLILPDTIRSIGGNVPMPNVPGVYKINYTFGVNQAGQSITATRYLFFLPVWSIVALLIGLLVSFVLYRKFRSRKRPIY